MQLIKILHKLEFPSHAKRLELYPPFWFMGVKVLHLDPGFLSMKLKLPLKWYAKNMHGTMFGGFIGAVADPIPVLLVSHIWQGSQAWVKHLEIDYLKPARSYLEVEVKVSPEIVSRVNQALETEGQSEQLFEYDFVDNRGRAIAHVKNKVFIRRKSHLGPSSQAMDPLQKS